MSTSFVYTSEQPRENSWLVYFNGIEVPTINVDVRMGVWAIPSAVISMPPDRELQRLGAEDRLQVAVFYKDNYYTELMRKSPDFRVMFEGDIHAWQYTNTASGRLLSFKAVNYLDLLDGLYTYFMVGLDNLAYGVPESQRDPSITLSPQYGPLFPAALLWMGLDTSAKKLIRRPYDLLANALIACGDEKQEEFKSAAAINFFGRYIRKTRLTDRIIPSPLLEIDHMKLEDDVEGSFPILRYARMESTLDTITKRAQAISNASMWNIVRDIYTKMYYEVTAITTAPIAQVNRTGKNVVVGEVLGPPVTSPTEEQPNCILNYVTKPEWRFGIPPACNVIFPSMITQFAYEENYAAQGTRLHINDGWLSKLFADGGKLQPFAVKGVAYPGRAMEELAKRDPAQGKSNYRISGKNFLIWPEEFFRGPNVIQEGLNDWFIYTALGASSKSRYAITQIPIEKDDIVKWSAVPKTDGTRVNPKTDLLSDGLASIAASGNTDRNAAMEAKLLWLRRIYARYEYYRQRSSCKNGVVTTIFNPYIVPGFPAVVFDELGIGTHIVAYVSGVTHTLGQGKSGTTITFTNAQTLDEYMHGIRESRVGGNPEERRYEILANPPNPIPEVRAVEQVWSLADQYFRELFHQHRVYKTPAYKTAAFDFTKAIELVSPSGEVMDVATALTAQGQNSDGVPHLNIYSRVQPTKDFRAIFEQASAAMRFVSRPICTLDEYIDFHPRGDRRQGKTIDPNDALQGKGAVYYDQILRLVQGPGTPVTMQESSGAQSIQVPDTRADWETHLLNYRKKVIVQLHPQET